ncbi:Uncharacterised protein [Proteus mirabilis]|nr:hypothetical protein [Proteus mirabilis]SUC08589.1 Uncharacterised protein [Proteus mirabilis]
MLGLAAMLFGAGASSYDYDDSDYPEYSEEPDQNDAIEEPQIEIPAAPAENN